MTRVQAVGVLLVALGLIYGLLYAAWLRKRRRHTSAAIAAERARGDGGADVAADDTGSTAKPAAQLSVEGTYISTTTALSRLERVTVEGLGNRASATLLITRGSPEELVRIERQGESTVLITGPRLVSVRRDRGMVGKFVGSNRMLVLQWRAEGGDLYETGFLPRYKADLERVESALWWHTGEQRTEVGAEPAETTPNVSDSPATEGNSTS
ncbi:hypothetical protein GCM10009867_00440 [Pedococcus aerophilus]|uniref:PH domain-containing protein n=1 Tax=Pedococcus aerophilus TaxID=436356 RepID=A0ABP6GSP6_9MICO